MPLTEDGAQVTEDGILGIGFRRQRTEARGQNTESVFCPLTSALWLRGTVAPRIGLLASGRGPLKERGFSLMEVLVTVLVISVGLLGLAVLQAQALKNNGQAYVRTQAVLGAYDLAERMRANPQGFKQGLYATVAANGGGAGGAAASAPMEDDGEGGGDKDCSAAQCNPKELAKYDLKEWRHHLAQVLPLGTGATCVDSKPGDGSPTKPKCDGKGPADVLAIKIWWDGNGDDKITRPAKAGDFDPRTDDPLYVLSFRL